MRPTRLAFEPITEAHAAELYGGFSNAQIYPYIPEDPPKSEESMRREFKEFREGPSSDSGEIWMNWAIREILSGRCIGKLQATVFADSSLWVGYKIDPKFWGNGFGTESLKWLVEQLHQKLTGKTIFAAVDIRNVASIRILEKSGFTVLKKEAAEVHGKQSEDLIYQFLRA